MTNTFLVISAPNLVASLKSEVVGERNWGSHKESSRGCPREQSHLEVPAKETAGSILTPVCVGDQASDVGMRTIAEM